MSTFEQLGNVARVRAIDSDGCRLYLEYTNGFLATVDSEEPFEFNVGSIVFVKSNENSIEAALSSSQFIYQ
jgi:hypothetical protein